jgi:hypothetical protein
MVSCANDARAGALGHWGSLASRFRFCEHYQAWGAISVAFQMSSWGPLRHCAGPSGSSECTWYRHFDENLVAVLESFRFFLHVGR